MPFTSSAPNFFGRFGAQTSPTDFNSAVRVFGEADKTRYSAPNLFSTIQAVRQNELERQTKQAQISKVLQDLAIEQKLAPVVQQLKEAELQSVPTENALKQAQADYYKQRGTTFGTPNQVYSFNPLTGELEQIADVPKGSIVRNTLTPEDIKAKAIASGEGALATKQKETGVKLGKLVKTLDVLKRQYDDALVDYNKNSPVEQRIAGTVAMIGARTGLKSNPKLLALSKNARLQAVQAVRLAGDVGAIPQQQIDETADAIQSEKLTPEERVASVKQFIEFALSQADEGSMDYLMKQGSFRNLVKEYGINLGQFSPNVGSDADPLGIL